MTYTLTSYAVYGMQYKYSRYRIVTFLLFQNILILTNIEYTDNIRKLKKRVRIEN